MMNEIRFALRQWLRHPIHVAVAAATLGLALGACTTVFSALDALVLRPLPYSEPERMVQMFETLPDGGLNGVSGGVYLDWSEGVPGFEGIALMEPVRRILSTGGGADAVYGLQASADFLRVLGAPPRAGRTFRAEEDGPGAGEAVVLVTEEAWRRRWGESPGLVGSTVSLDGETHTVVGILPAGLFPRGILSPFPVEFVEPIRATRSDAGRFSRSEHWASVYGRLAQGVRVAEADARLRELRQQLAPAYPAYKKAWGVKVMPLVDRVARPSRSVVGILLAAVAVVLLIACANVASLLLTRATARQSEMAVRAALGAGAGRLLRQGLVESLLVAALGGVIGLGLAVLGTRGITVLASDVVAQDAVPRPDWRVFAFSALLVGITAVLAGGLPAWRMRRPDLVDSLKSGSRGATARGRWQAQSLLVTGEVALTVVLLGATGMLLRSLAHAVQVDPGFDPSRAIAFEVTLPETAFPDDRARHALSVRLRERIRALPSVEAVGTGMGIPFRGGAFGERVGVIGRPRGDQDPIVRVNYVSPGFHESLGMRLLAGRVLEEADDRPDADRVLLVNRTAANHFFGTESALDRRLTMLGKTWRVVGVVADVVGSRVEDAAALSVHVPHCHNTARFSMVVRVRGEGSAVAGALAGAAREVDPRLAISDVRSLADARHSSFTPRRLMLGLIGGFGVTAAGMAGLGLYGVLACSVAQRRRELAIRLAMGAGRGGVVGLVLREALAMGVAGALLGWVLSLATHRVLASHLYGVSLGDPWVLAGTGLCVVAVAAVSAWLPARRASSVEPVELLRSE